MSEIRLVSRHAATILVGQLAVMAFGVADTVIAGRYSDAALAALSVGSALYISVYSARVSFWLGAGRPDHAKRVVFMGLKLTALIALALAAIISIAGPLLAGWYSTTPEVVALASTLLVWVAFYHVADAMQALCAFLLRCYRITMTPLALYGVLLWGLGLFGGYQLAYVGIAGHAPTQAASSFWAASTLAIGLVACCLLGLLLYAVRRSQWTPGASIQAG
ncbi:MATE family efflux transporter [Polaromonas sp.]|jgi:MATE family multidrug resistance protein|uniref:MATE family efflux transporter n=1 Tax=Polaromonas sp. TaxID=1869339 RepID=UPI003BB5463E